MKSILSIVTDQIIGGVLDPSNVAFATQQTAQIRTNTGIMATLRRERYKKVDNALVLREGSSIKGKVIGGGMVALVKNL